MKKADQIIADKIIANQLYLMRFTASEKRKVFDILLQMQKELKAQLLNGFTDYSKARMMKLLNQCTAIIDAYYKGIQTELNIDGLAKQQAKATVNSIATIGVDVSLPSAATFKAMLSETLLQGAPLKAWWAKQSEDTAFKFTAQVRQGVAQGENLQQIITRVVGSKKKGITGVLDVSRRNASTLVHDSIMQIANDSKLATYRENADILNGVQWLSTFDMHTCETCAAYHGATWDLDGNPINGTTLPFQSSPLHPNDRCVLTPVTKTYRELGIDIPEMKGSTRASDLGQIPTDTSFSSFLDRHSKAEQDQFFGKGKADLWRSGKITLRDLVSQNGRPLTLSQLSG
jgi:SPP1 gp7 family putative phage head morphogenesis protein